MNEARRRRFSFTFADCKRELQKKKTFLLFGLFFGMLLSLLFVLQKPLFYSAHATYFDDGHKTEHAFPITGRAGLFTSQKFLRYAAEKVGLQIRSAPLGFFEKIFGRFSSHLSSSFALDEKGKEEFCFSSVRFLGKNPRKIYLRFLTTETFELLDEKYAFLTEGKVGESLHCKDLYFTLQRTPSSFDVDHLYGFELLPWRQLLGELEERLKLSSDSFDPRLINFSYCDQTRSLAAAFLNQLMMTYHHFVSHENEEMKIASQLEKKKKMNPIPEQSLFLFCNAEIEALRHLYDLEMQKVQIIAPAFPSPISTLPLIETQIEQIEGFISKLKQGQLSLTQSHLLKLPKLSSFSQELIAFFEKEHAHLSAQKETFVSPKHEFALSFEEAKKSYNETLKKANAYFEQIEKIEIAYREIKKGEICPHLLERVLGITQTQTLLDWTHFLFNELQKEQPSHEKERLDQEVNYWQGAVCAHLFQIRRSFEIESKMMQDKALALYQYLQSLLTSEIQVTKEYLNEVEKNLYALSKTPEKQSPSTLQNAAFSPDDSSVEESATVFLSRPLDFAEVPLKPVRSLLLPSVLFGGGSGLFLPIIGILLSALFTGLPISSEMLKRWHLPCGGVLSHDLDHTIEELSSEDLETLRNIAAFTSPHKQGKAALTISLCGSGGNFSYLLASLFARKGSRVLLIQTSPDSKGHTSYTPGLYQYLEGELSSCPLYHRKEYDFLPSGKAPLHAAELTTSSQFCDLLAELKQEYDVVLFHNSSPAFSAESLELLRQSDAGALSIIDEKSPYLLPFLKNLSTPRAIPVIFITHEMA